MSQEVAQILLGQRSLVTPISTTTSLIQRQVPNPQPGQPKSNSTCTLLIVASTTFTTLTFGNLDQQNNPGNPDSMTGVTFGAGITLYNVESFTLSAGACVAYWNM